MAFNGSGLFNIDSTGQPVSANTLIESSVFNALTADLATGLSNCITKDGQQTVTANLPMATYRHTGVGNAVARTDYAAAGQVQDGKLNWVDGGGTADAITATYSPAITALVDGQLCCVRATAANATTTPTFAPNGLTARTIVKKGGSALAVGDISADGHELILRYDLTNTQWELLNPAPASLAANIFTGLQQFDKGADIASGATVDLGTATGNSVDVTHSTGTTAITSLGGASLQAGAEIETRFVISGGTLSLTHHATNLYLAGGANITLANGDVIRWRKMHDSNAEWKMVGGVRANGAAWAGNSVYGQCILDKVSTNLVLSPCNGNLLTINGVAYEIPDAGVSLSAAAVSDGFKYIYAYMNAGTMTLEASTTARATSTTAGNKGVQIKSGDDSRTLVGAAYCQSNAWTDVFNSRLVLSWFNRRDITGRAWLTTNRTVAAAGPQEIHTEGRVFFICWADEAVHAHANGTASNSNAFQTTDMCIGIDGVSVIGGISKQANTTATSVNSLAATTQAPAGQLTEAALHYLVLAGGASANTATYYGGADNASRCEINFRTRG